jgi:molybdate transport system substrate-binding protein
MPAMQRKTCRKFFRRGSLRFFFTGFFRRRPRWIATKRPLRLALLLAATLPVTRAAETVSVAAAANLVYAVEELNAAFKKATPDVKVATAVGASGNLVAQIRNGAPFDVFLSADLDYPRALVAAGKADPATFTKFAVGRLVLWTTRPDLALQNLPAVVRDPAVRKLAIANLATAPYGRAAKQALEKLDLWTTAEPKIVIGENITQAAQFVETGNADAGLVAMSFVLSPKLRKKGRWIEISPTLYEPLEQAAVLTTRAAQNPTAKAYLDFLRSEAAREIFRRYGYGRPAE